MKIDLNKKKQLHKNINAIDVEIGVLSEELIDSKDNTYDAITAKIDKLAEIRSKLIESKVNDSYSKEIVSGVIGILGMVLVLKHEKTDIITSKAYAMATKLFRG